MRRGPVRGAARGASIAAVLLVALSFAAAASAAATAGGASPQHLAPAIAAQPTPDPTATSTVGPATSGDPSTVLRSSGQGAGAAGNPGGALWAFAVVVVLGLLCAGATAVYIRATDASRRRSHPDIGSFGKSRDNVKLK